MHTGSSIEADANMNVKVTLEDVLSFVTSATAVPPLGFDPLPQIFFLHRMDSTLPIVSTCCPSISLPTHEDYKKFKETMVEALIGAIGFGRV